MPDNTKLLGELMHNAEMQRGSITNATSRTTVTAMATWHQETEQKNRR